MSSPDQSKGVFKWSTPFERGWSSDWVCAYWCLGTQVSVKQLRADKMWYIAKCGEPPMAGPLATLEDAQTAAEMMAEMGVDDYA